MSQPDESLDAIEILEELNRMGHGQVVAHAIDRIRLAKTQEALEALRARLAETGG